MAKHPGGSGRGNKGVAVIDDPSRPDCKHCGGFMRANQTQWACTICGRKVERNYKTVRATPDDFYDVWGFDTDRAERHAAKCHKGKRLIVTSAQNNTEAHAILPALIRYAKYHKCQLAIIPSHYKNITLFKRGDKKEWCDAVQPYLVKGDIQFGNVLVRSDVKINATTLWPLASKQSHGGPHNWTVFGHPQIQSEPVASPGNMMPKRMYTTASCTLPNYSVSDNGEKARFHHCQGALIIENAGSHCFVRRLNADSDGSFYDLDKYVTADGVTTGHSIAALIPGDEHVKFNAVKGVTYTNRDSIVRTLRPEYIVRHDILDGYAGSHHHDKDPVIQFRKHHNGDNNYRRELDQCVDFINETTPDYSTTLIVPSNHHDHLTRWLNTVDLKKDHTNALLIAELSLLVREAVMRGDDCDPFKLYASPLLTCRHEFLNRNEPFLIGDVDQSQHGDVGANGSRGAAKSMARSTFKMNIGHSHGARECQGVVQAGTSTHRLEYERGLSDHSTTHIVQYANHKRTLIDIIDGRWHL